MDTKLISVDAGNGGTNAILARASGSYKQVYFPSVRSRVSGDSLGLGSQFEMQYEYMDWNGYRYVYGDFAPRVNRQALERHIGKYRYGNEFQQSLIARAVTQLGVKKGLVDLVTFAPPKMYSQAKVKLQEELMKNDGVIEVHVKGDKKPRDIQYNSVQVFPEGVGAAACFLIDKKGNLVNSDLMSGDVLILDLGVYTADALLLTDGLVNFDNLDSTTFENDGLKAHVLEPILREVKKATQDADLLQTEDIDYALRQGLETGAFTLALAGQQINLTPVVDKYTKRYSTYLVNNIIDGYFNGLRGIKSIILVGGGSTFTQDHFSTVFGSKVVNTDQQKLTKNIEPVFMNAVGGARLAMALKAQQA